MGRKLAKTTPYVPPNVYKPHHDFDDPLKTSYPGYMSPPPTPFLAEPTLSGEPEVMRVKGRKQIGSRILLTSNNRKYIVEDVLQSSTNPDQTKCVLREVPSTQWPSFT
jgi:hypothetical protein